jgi:hypothetical protein
VHVPARRPSEQVHSLGEEALVDLAKKSWVSFFMHSSVVSEAGRLQ